MTARAGTTPARDRGMTLIELVVAMAIFALVAVMGLQGLSGMLRIRDRLAEVDRTTAQLARAVALLRNDLTAIVPMRFFPPDAPSTFALARDADGTAFSLSVGGQPTLEETGNPAGLARVEWRVDPAAATLSRQVWTTLTPADSGARHAPVVLMPDVQELRLRSYWQGQGWIDGPVNPMLQNVPQAASSDEDGATAAPELYSDFIPAAIEVTLVTATHGDITLIEALK